MDKRVYIIRRKGGESTRCKKVLRMGFIGPEREKQPKLPQARARVGVNSAKIVPDGSSPERTRPTIKEFGLKQNITN